MFCLPGTTTGLMSSGALDFSGLAGWTIAGPVS